MRTNTDQKNLCVWTLFTQSLWRKYSFADILWSPIMEEDHAWTKIKWIHNFCKINYENVINHCPKHVQIRTRKNSVFGHFLCSECLYSQVQLKEWQVQQLFHRKVKISAVKIPEYVLGPLRKLHFIAWDILKSCGKFCTKSFFQCKYLMKTLTTEFSASW